MDLPTNGPIPDPDGELMPLADGETDIERFERTANLTTAIQTADKSGWVVSVTPSGGWIPAAIAGNTGIGLSQRMQFCHYRARICSTS